MADKLLRAVVDLLWTHSREGIASRNTRKKGGKSEWQKARLTSQM